MDYIEELLKKVRYMNTTNTIAPEVDFGKENKEKIGFSDAVPEIPKELNQEEEKSDFVQWNRKGENNYIPTGELKLYKNVPAGIFKVCYNRDWGFYLSKQTVSLDELLVLPQKEQESILTDITKFWEREEQFKKYKYTYKRGILLYGEAGCGKSSIINLLVDKIVKKHGGVVFFLNTPDELQNFCTFIKDYFKSIQPNTPILCVLEDLETLTVHHETETLLLNTLDGASQMDNIVFLACTNYPEQLKERILNRPNRFDRRYYIGAPDATVRKFYFEKKLKKDDLKNIDIDKWVKETSGFSIAHLGEVIKSVLVLGNEFNETIERLQGMKKKISSFDFGKENKEKIGFSN